VLASSKLPAASFGGPPPSSFVPLALRKGMAFLGSATLSLPGAIYRTIV